MKPLLLALTYQMTSSHIFFRCIIAIPFDVRNIYGIPLNLLVVSVFLSIKSLGVQGALGCATAALAVSSACMNLLNAGVGSEEKKVNA